MDSSALLSQQLNNRWLKKASIQSGSALENHTEESPQAADKTHRHTKRTHMQITWIVRVAHAANGRTVNIFFLLLLQTVISLPTELHARHTVMRQSKGHVQKSEHMDGVV